jgi:hypothetical protein
MTSTSIRRMIEAGEYVPTVQVVDEAPRLRALVDNLARIFLSSGTKLLESYEWEQRMLEYIQNLDRADQLSARILLAAVITNARRQREASSISDQCQAKVARLSKEIDEYRTKNFELRQRMETIEPDAKKALDMGVINKYDFNRVTRIDLDLKKREKACADKEFGVAMQKKRLAEKQDELDALLRGEESKLSKRREREKRDFTTRKVAEALEAQARQFSSEIERRVAAEVDKAIEERLNAERMAVRQRQLDDDVVESINAVIDNEAERRDGERALRVTNKAKTFDGHDKPALAAHTQCVVCKTNEVAVLYDPCGHVVTCLDCAPRAILMCEHANCPVCNQVIRDFRRVYIGA